MISNHHVVYLKYIQLLYTTFKYIQLIVMNNVFIMISKGELVWRTNEDVTVVWMAERMGGLRPRAAHDGTGTPNSKEPTPRQPVPVLFCAEIEGSIVHYSTLIFCGVVCAALVRLFWPYIYI